MLSANFVESLKSGFSSALVEASLVTPVGPINVFQGLPCVISLVALGYIVVLLDIWNKQYYSNK